MDEKEKILNKLNELSSYSNFLKLVLFLTDKNLNCNFKELETRDLKVILNEYEISFLLGLWLKNRNKVLNKNLTIEKHAKIIHQLMDDYHMTFLSFFPKLDPKKTDYQIDFLNSPEAIKETIYYAGSGAYDYQYFNFYEKKYKLDENWILENKGFKLKEAKELFNYIKTLLNYKLNTEKFRRDISKFYTISANNYVFKKNPNFIKILDSISIKDDEVLNQNFNEFGDFNTFRIRPVLKNGNNYTIPIPYLLAETIYDSPFYWMNNDKKYSSIALKNRGDSAEKIVKEILERKINKTSIHTELEVKQKKTETLTDIDVCIIENNKMLIFQVKAKRLTQLSKEGNIKQFHKDFKLAIQDANNQALIPYEYILKNNCFLLSKESGKKIDYGKIEEIYHACIVLDNYASITAHTRLFFHQENTIPVAMSIFDLEVILDYINDFDNLFDYLKKRTINSKYFFADNELTYFGMYLKNDLKKFPNSDFVGIDNDFAQKFDKDYYPKLLNRNEPNFIELIKNIGRNDFCFCGSGIKFKKCCL
ncbi:YecA family protein [Tenacibaculum sp. SDUM215027]|uniref:YecA family protein n=1 Tax=Tenacibaculum sp. SDUM215027 TaxID=3422596 RepID=UPI003D320564